ncbi:choice-of-anchor M domain-containing protein [Nakamurella leprariae]|uniref:Choice-of-anchor M domain-containing protein n=1 Tax=Nakamurella leprariae TaxID=2803911 RepID=A0A938YJK3_9ACTN|nr:choice-of-anchor M domain-containing protein [Nakamurella leprariae]MBM9469334.1 choice-of-anchor M domain-containing protein [Nakamurella leprariae]
MSNRLLPRAFALTLATGLAAVATSVALALPAAAAGPYDGKLILDVGHVDGLDIQSQGDQIVLNVFDDRDALNAVTRDPADVVFHIKDEAAFEVPAAGLGPAFSFMPAGQTVYLLPQVQSQNPDVVWLGWASQRTAPGVISANLTLTMSDVEGPGDILLFQNDAFGAPVNTWGSGGGLSPSVTVSPNAHVHANWVFTEPGAYTAHFQASGTSAVTGQTITTAVEEYSFHVGALPVDEPEPVETELSISGLAASYAAGDTVTLNAVQDPETGEDHYHWFSRAAGATDWTVVSGAATGTYSFPATEALNGTEYLVRLYDHDHAVIAESAPVTLTVTTGTDPGPGPDPEPQPELSQTITATLGEDAGALVVSVDPADRDVVMGPFALTGDGQEWASSGELRPVLVTDTRSSTPGWNVSGQVGDFTSATDTVGAQHLGWTPQVVEQSAEQGAVAGSPVAPGTADGEGLDASRTLVTAPAGAGLGTATAGGQLDLHVPTDTEPGTYTALLTLTAI